MGASSGDGNVFLRAGGVIFGEGVIFLSNLGDGVTLVDEAALVALNEEAALLILCREYEIGEPSIFVNSVLEGLPLKVLAVDDLPPPLPLPHLPLPPPLPPQQQEMLFTKASRNRLK